MKVLFTGRGTSGSWKIRGEQIAAAMGAKAIPVASQEQCAEADTIVVVKRVTDGLLANIRKSGTPWVWDIVDAYPQPQCSTWNREQSLEWLRHELKRLKPDAVVAPNRRVRDDLGLGEVIYHHCRPGILTNPIRERIKVIGYEGSPAYIGGWAAAIGGECARRGLVFMVNPPKLADVDVVLALRGAGFNGYPQRHWKSNVKLANAHGSGTPFIGAREDGYLETSSGAEYWAADRKELATALDWLEDADTRAAVRERFLAAAFTVEQAADRYRQVLCALKS